MPPEGELDLNANLLQKPVLPLALVGRVRSQLDAARPKGAHVPLGAAPKAPGR